MKTLRKWSILEIWENKFWMKLFTHITAPHRTVRPDHKQWLTTQHLISWGRHIRSSNELAVLAKALAVLSMLANAMMERLSNTLHLKTATVAMSLSQTILKNRCINQLFYNQEKVDTLTKLFSECGVWNDEKSERIEKSCFSTF